ncbi:MAG: hypothetical protein ABL901_06605 [Hyphomicrobiaceae bacterium]
MRSFLAWLVNAVGTVAHGLTMPLLTGIGGILATLAIPVLRGLAGVCLIVAAVALASDMGTATLGGQKSIEPTSVVRHWQTLGANSIEQTRSFLNKRTRPWVWEAFSTPLRMPTFVFFTLLGLMFGYLGRRRHRVNIFAN